MGTIALFVEHFTVTLIGTAAGVLIGGVTGLGLARLLAHLYMRSDRVLKLAVFLPWRTALMGLLVPFAVPLVTVTTVGLGAKLGIVSVGVAVAGLVIAFTSGILLTRRYPKSQRVELIAAARTVATVAVVLQTAFGAFGAGGLGYRVIQHFRVFEIWEAVGTYSLILVAVLIFDLVVGTLQYVMTARETAPKFDKPLQA